MKIIVRSAQLFVAALGFTLTLVHGAVFNFSYTFEDGVTASGSLSGTQNGQFVDNVSSVSLFFNGAQMPGSIFASRYDPMTASFLSGPVVSFDALQSNFVFSNSDLANGNFSYDAVFYITRQTLPGDVSAVGYSIPQSIFGSQDDPVISQRWLLTPSGATVPDSGATIAMLGVTVFGMGLLSRKRSSRPLSTGAGDMEIAVSNFYRLQNCHSIAVSRARRPPPFSSASEL